MYLSQPHNFLAIVQHFFTLKFNLVFTRGARLPAGRTAACCLPTELVLPQQQALTLCDTDLMKQLGPFCKGQSLEPGNSIYTLIYFSRSSWGHTRSSHAGSKHSPGPSILPVPTAKLDAEGSTRRKAVAPSQAAAQGLPGFELFGGACIGWRSLPQRSSWKSLAHGIPQSRISQLNCTRQ